MSSLIKSIYYQMIPIKHFVEVYIKSFGSAAADIWCDASGFIWEYKKK